MSVLFKTAPEKVLSAPDISPCAKLIMIDVLSFVFNSKNCFVNNKYFVDRNYGSLSTINRAINMLESSGYIIRRYYYTDGTVSEGSIEDKKEIDQRVLIPTKHIMYELNDVRAYVDQAYKELQTERYAKSVVIKDLKKIWE